MDAHSTAADASDKESSLDLIERAQKGDQIALDALLARYRPRLRRWAHRRLPAWARDLADTDDLVQETLIKVLRNLRGFEARSGAGFQSYLRSAVANAIRDEIRRIRKRPEITLLEESHASDAPSPLERAVGRRRLDRYESALARLPAEERDAIVARFEFGFTHGELAAAIGKHTPDAARKLCQRALAHLLDLMEGTGVKAS